VNTSPSSVYVHMDTDSHTETHGHASPLMCMNMSLLCVNTSLLSMYVHMDTDSHTETHGHAFCM